MEIIDVNTVLTIVAISLSFIGLLLFITLLTKLKKPDIKLDTRFFEQLDQKFALGLVINKDDIIVLANSFRREHLAFYDINKLLEDYLRYLINQASNATEDVKKVYVERHQIVVKILNLENEEKPYNELPAEERRIFRAINSAVKTGEKDETLNALEDLRIIISTKNKIFHQSNTINKFSIPLAVVGLIFTIYFGIKSLPNEKAINSTPTRIELDSTKTVINDTVTYLRLKAM